MNRNEVIHLLAYVAAADRRTVGEADVAIWTETLPAWLDLDTAKAAVRMFFAEPERDASGSTWFTPKHLMRCAKNVKRQREVEAARERAKHPAIEAAYTPPAEGWRARVPGGYPEAAEDPTEKAEVPGGNPPVPEFSEAQLAENRRRLAAIMEHGKNHPDHPDHEHTDCCK